MIRTRNQTRKNYIYTKEQEMAITKVVQVLSQASNALVELLRSVPQRKKREVKIYAAKVAIENATQYLKNSGQQQ